MSCSCDNNPLILPVGATGPQGPQGEPGFGFEHFVGEEFGGGVVFHVYRDADGTEHGLVVSIIDLGMSQYSNITSTSIGVYSRYDGKINTNAMSTQTLASTGAWKVCQDYSYDEFTDWYLPAIDELKFIYFNEFNINKTLVNIPTATLLDGGQYWSSTERGSDRSFAIEFNEGVIYTDTDKSSLQNVRAIRQY